MAAIALARRPVRNPEGSISELYGFAVHGGSEAGSWGCGFGESDKVEPVQVAVETLGHDAAKIAQKAFRMYKPNLELIR